MCHRISSIVMIDGYVNQQGDCQILGPFMKKQQITSEGQRLIWYPSYVQDCLISTALWYKKFAAKFISFPYWHTNTRMAGNTSKRGCQKFRPVLMIFQKMSKMTVIQYWNISRSNSGYVVCQTPVQIIVSKAPSMKKKEKYHRRGNPQTKEEYHRVSWKLNVFQ